MPALGGTAGAQADEGWHLVGGEGEPAFTGGWGQHAAGNPVAFRKDSHGVVYLRGLASGGTPGATSHIFTLPVGYRPASGVTNHFAVGSNAAYGTLRVNDAGEVNAFNGSGTWFTLEGVSFKADA